MHPHLKGLEYFFLLTLPIDEFALPEKSRKLKLGLGKYCFQFRE